MASEKKVTDRPSDLSELIGNHAVPMYTTKTTTYIPIECCVCEQKPTDLVLCNMYRGDVYCDGCFDDLLAGGSPPRA